MIGKKCWWYKESKFMVQCWSFGYEIVKLLNGFGTTSKWLYFKYIPYTVYLGFFACYKI